MRGGPWFFKASPAPPTRPLAGGAAQRCAEKRERGRGWGGGGGTMEICGWSGGRGETEREREILHSVLLQQQLQLHPIRRHQRYFCNRSHSALVCARPSLIYPADCRAERGGERRAGWRLLKKRREAGDRVGWLRAPALSAGSGASRGSGGGGSMHGAGLRRPRSIQGTRGRAAPRPAPRSPNAIFKTASCLILIPAPSSLLGGSSSSRARPVCHQSGLRFK